MNQQAYELYRRSSIGSTLIDSLDELVHLGRIEPQLAMKILQNFDKIVTDVLADKVKARLTFKGHLDTYRFCDEVWTFLIKDVTFKLDNQSPIQADKIKIVSCNSKRPGETMTITSDKSRLLAPMASDVSSSTSSSSPLSNQKDEQLFFLLNLAFNALMWALFTSALTRASSTTRVSIVNTSSNFLLTALLGLIIFSEKLPGLWWVGAALLVAGCVVIGARKEEEVEGKGGKGNDDGVKLDGNGVGERDGAEGEVERYRDEERDEGEEAVNDDILDLDHESIEGKLGVTK
ncbi:MAG: hypothetical protein Q9184_004648 [Pyrenodesmia sp. 2 TL-2023]